MNRHHRQSSTRARSLLALVVLVVFAAGLALGQAAPAEAEGSAQVYPTDATCAANSASGACRANIEWRTSLYGPTGKTQIRRRTLFQVYAKAGEELLMGSSAVGVDSGDVLVWNPGVVTDRDAQPLPTITSGTNGFKCSTQRAAGGAPAALGKITSRALELAGPRAVTGGGNPSGYIPCHYTAPSAGIYTVVFYGPDGDGTDTDGGATGDTKLAAASNFDATQNAAVAAWDLTVRANQTTTTNITGRLFTYALGAGTAANPRPLKSTFYVTTLDGFTYQTDTKGMDPNGFLFYGNQTGFKNADGTAPLAHDVLASSTGSQMNALSGGVDFAAPQYPISFAPLASEVLAALSIPTTPIAPAVSATSFAGNLVGNTSQIGAGGTFSLTTNVAGVYEIIISRNGVSFDPGASTNRVLRGVKASGTTTVAWDGKDNSGANFPVGTNYAFKSNLHAGEYHFPLIDSEASTLGGPVFKLTNPPGGTCPFGRASCTTAFYDDRGYHTAGPSGSDVGTPGSVLCGTNPPTTAFSDPLTGYDSSSNQRAYGTDAGTNTNTPCTGSFGDVKGLDTWTFFPSSAVSSNLNVIGAAPAAANDSGSTPYQTPLVVAAPGVLGNDTGSGITVTSNTDPTHGTVSIAADGSYTYTPADGYAGPDSFTYTITDLGGRTASATVNLTVGLPSAPGAVNDSGTTPYQTPLVVAGPGVLGNDSGAGITVTGHTNPAHGTVSIAGDGSYTYTPANGYAGPDSFTYTLTDAFGRTSTATVSLTVSPPPAPVASDDSGSTPYQTPLVVPAPGVLGNDTGAAITVTGHTSPAHGLLAMAADGSYTYTPSAGYTGPDSFDYTITDAVGQTSTATVRITVGLPAAPTAVDDSATTPFETPIAVVAPGTLGNDSGTGITVTSNTDPAHGTVSIAADGSYTYTPATGFTGTDSFDYTITDGFSRTATATVTITVTPPAAPTAVDDSGSTPYETPFVATVPGALGNDSGTRITVTANTDPSHGTVAIAADGSYTYTPAPGFAGDDSFDYTITDAAGQTDVATVTITVAPPAGPVAADDAGSTPFETPLSILAPGTLGNDAGTGISVTSNTDPAHGTLTLGADGAYLYTPAVGFTGTDSFDYTITDAFGRTSTATVTITVDPPAVPAANDDAHATPYETTLVVPAPGVLGNDAGVRIEVTSSTATQHGSVSVAADGSFTYTPDAGFAGVDSFDYTITDAAGQTAGATATITVDPPVGPQAIDDTGSTPYETPLVVPASGALGNDSGTGISVTANGNPDHGTVSVAADGSFTYTPDDGFAGEDVFGYTITDAFGRTSSALVTITVDPPAAPLAVDDYETTPYETPLVVIAPGALVNDSGTGITVTGHTDPAHGSVAIAADGSYTYSLAMGFAGTDSFDYTITDGFGRTSTATVHITVDPPPAPLAIDDTGSTPYETPLVVAAPGALVNDSGTGITVTSNTDPAHGTVSIAADGSYTYTPAAGFTGTDSFTYTITDGFDRTDTATVRITVDPPAAPKAVDDVDTTPYETPLVVAAPGTLGNDSGTGITVTGNTDPAHGTVAIAADGSYTYTPASGFAGTDSFDYTITDEVGQTSTATVTITVAPPGAPVATDDAGTTPYETPLVVAGPGTLVNDSGTGISVTSNTDPAHGSVSLAADGSFTYTPAGGFAGTDSFDYTITDAFGRTSTATVTVTVDPPAAPDAVDDDRTTGYETPLVVPAPGALANDSGTGISVTSNTDPGHGTVAIAADGSFTYTPAGGFAGTDSFDYTITDGFGRSDAATVTITVDPPVAPKAVDDVDATPYEVPLVVAAPGALGNDSGTGITVTGNTDPAHGTVSIAGDGSYTYTPAAGFTGTDSFDYTITDEVGQTSTATVTITVAPPGAPSASADFGTTPYETPLVVAAPGTLVNDSGTGITVTANTDPVHGTVAIAADGSFTYTPNHGFAGVDSFDYTITDEVGQTAGATVTVTVDPPAKPVAVDDTGSTPYETPLVAAVPGAMGNDSGTGITVTSNTDPAHGTVAIASDGSYTYTPAAGFTGVDSFTYTITDEVGQTSTATVTITVDPPAAPVATDDSATTPYETPLVVGAPGTLGNDSGTGITVTSNTDPAHGSVSLAADGSFTYTPVDGFAGDDSFDYTITDEVGQTASATVTITVAPPGAPVAVDDAHTTPYETPLALPGPGVVGNDSGTGITVTANTDPGHGTVALAADGSFTYTPAAGFAGVDTFDYTITDAFGRTSAATVTITVDPPAAPVATDDTGSTPYETALVVAAPGTLGNDSGTGITVTGNTDPAHGTVAIAGDGSYTYTPEPGFAGTDSFTYTITDGFDRTDTATVTITVAPPGEPLAVDDAYTTPYETPLVVAVPGTLGNDSGTGITVTSNTDPTHGTVALAADGSFTYSLAMGFAGTDSFDYTITDAFGRTSTATVTITVDPPAAPLAIDDSGSTPYETPLVVAAPGTLGNDSGTGITVTSNTDPAHGAVAIAADGSYTYTPEPGFAGTDSFTYTIADGFDRTDTATVTITVDPPAAPKAVDDVASTPYETPLVISAPGAMGNDSGTGITVTANTDPVHGTVAIAADGSYTYTPASGFTGTDGFDYTITDEVGQTSKATVTITVAQPGAPVATADTASTPFETPITLAAPGILGNDSGTGISVTSNTSPGHGTATAGANGTTTYVPATGFSGVDSFDYTITDAFGRTSSTTVTITVVPPKAPIARDDVDGTPYETPLVVAAPGTLGNDAGTRIAVSSHTDPSHGTLAIAADGSFTYTPAPGFTGTDGFDYTITDAAGQSATATVTLNVGPPNAPKASDDASSTSFETPVTVAAPGALGNDSGTGITVTGHTDPGHGSVTMAVDGGYTYTPAAGFTGTDSFDYTITDEVGQTATATVTITVAPPSGPKAVDDATTTPFETPVTVAVPGALGNDSGEGITVTSNTDPGHGSVSLAADGSFTYTPAAGFAGVDSFDYTITDAFDRTSTATVSVTVAEPGAPVAVDDAGTTPFETPWVLAAPGALGNDVGTGITVTSTTDPGHGTAAIGADGRVTYTPAAGFTGTDSFDYTITDAFGRTSTATVTITVDPPAAPVATDDSGSTPFETPLVVALPGTLGNDSGTAITVTGHTDPSHGSVAIAADGSFTYTPAAGFTGTDSFDYTITDGAGQTASATVTITVDPPAAPTAVDDTYSTGYQTQLDIAAPGIIGNDTGAALTVTAHGSPAHGTLVQRADGSLTYVPDAGFVGTDAYEYTVTDAAGQTAAATVTIGVAGPGGPIATADSGTTAFETTLAVAAPGALGNDSGTGISVTAHTPPSHGSIALAADGSWTYIPDPGFSGVDSLTYTITDEVGQQASTTITITVTPPGAPTAAPDAASTPFETPVTVPAPGALGNDSGTGISVTGSTAPLHGTLDLAADGTWTYTPDAGFHGVDAVTYTITDDAGQTASSTITVTVDPPQGPTAVDDSYDVPAGAPFVVSGTGVLGNDSGTAITVTINTDPSHGTVVVNPDGSMTYTPDVGFSGTDTFDYTITDGAGQTASATVTLLVADAGTTTTTADPTTTTTTAPANASTTTSTTAVTTSTTAPSSTTTTLEVDATSSTSTSTTIATSATEVDQGPGGVPTGQDQSNREGSLARTGTTVAPLVVWGLALLAFGLVLVVGGRRVALADRRRGR